MVKWKDLLPIIPVVIGAVISLSAQWTLARFQSRQDERKELRRAAADLIGTYGQAWSALLGARKRGDQLPGDDELAYGDRNIKYSYFAMCPGADAHFDAVEANRIALKELVAAFNADEPNWKLADKRMLEAQRQVQEGLRERATRR